MKFYLEYFTNAYNLHFPPFTLKIHKVYMSLFKQEPINTKDILDQSLWLNQNIIINNKYVYLKNPGKQGHFTL